MTSPPPTQQRLVATSATDTISWFIDWVPAIAMDAATAVLVLRQLTGGLRATVVVQTAEVRIDKPDAPTVIGTIANQNQDGEYFYSTSDFSLSSLTAGKTFVRFGVAFDLASTPGLGQADATLELAWRQCGHLLPRWSGHVVATDTQKRFQPIGRWLPALGALKLEATIVVTGLSGLELRLCYRTAATSPNSPDAWDQNQIGTLIQASGESNSGEQALTLTGKMWVQPGFYYTCQSGQSFGQADVEILPAVRSAT